MNAERWKEQKEAESLSHRIALIHFNKMHVVHSWAPLALLHFDTILVKIEIFRRDNSILHEFMNSTMRFRKKKSPFISRRCGIWNFFPSQLHLHFSWAEQFGICRDIVAELIIRDVMRLDQRRECEIIQI